jgi:hypothetical protein
MSLNNDAPPYLWTKEIIEPPTSWTSIQVGPLEGIPKGIYIGKKPKVDNLKAYGCLVYILTPKVQRDKLESWVKKCMFIGYNVWFKVDQCFDMRTKKIFITKDVVNIQFTKHTRSQSIRRHDHHSIWSSCFY